MEWPSRLLRKECNFSCHKYFKSPRYIRLIIKISRQIQSVRENMNLKNIKSFALFFTVALAGSRKTSSMVSSRVCRTKKFSSYISPFFRSIINGTMFSTIIFQSCIKEVSNFLVFLNITKNRFPNIETSDRTKFSFFSFEIKLFFMNTLHKESFSNINVSRKPILNSRNYCLVLFLTLKFNRHDPEILDL